MLGNTFLQTSIIIAIPPASAQNFAQKSIKKAQLVIIAINTQAIEPNIKAIAPPFLVLIFLYIIELVKTVAIPIRKSASSPTQAVELNGSFINVLIATISPPAKGPKINPPRIAGKLEFLKNQGIKKVEEIWV